MSKITFVDKVTGSQFTAADAQEIKTVVNANDDSKQTAAQVQALIDAAVSALLAGAPGALNTLKELADALGSDANFAATVTTALAAKVPLTRNIDTGTGLLGGGTLATDKTLSLDFATSGEVVAGTDTTKPINSVGNKVALDLKVDKVTGKGLSTEDYTTTDKERNNDAITSAIIRLNTNHNKSITPELYTSSVVTGRYYTDTTLKFSTKTRLASVLIASTVIGTVKIGRLSVSDDNFAGGATTATLVETIDIVLISGVTEYPINIIMLPGEYLGAYAPVSGNVRHKATTGSIINAFAAAGGVTNAPSANRSIGLGYKINTTNNILDVVITPQLYTSSAAINRPWTDTSLYFSVTKRIITITIPCTSESVVQISRGTSTDINLGASSILTILQTISVNVVPGTDHYDIDLTVNAGEFLILNTSVLGGLKYLSTSGYILTGFAGNGTVSGSPTSGRLGVGFTVFYIPQTDEERKIALLNFIITNASPLSLSAVNTLIGLNNNTQNKLFGQLMMLFGDSILYGFTPSGSVDSFAKLVATRNGMTLTNKAIPGAPLAYNGTTDQKTSCIALIVKQTIELSPTLKYVVVFGTTNDITLVSPIEDDGVVSSEITTIFGTTSFNVATVKGAIKYIIKKIVDYDPNVKLIFVTPLNHKTLANDYRNAIISQCSDYGIPVFDMYGKGGIAPLRGINTVLMADVQHPLQTGSERLSNTFESDLRLL